MTLQFLLFTGELLLGQVAIDVWPFDAFQSRFHSIPIPLRVYTFALLSRELRHAFTPVGWQPVKTESGGAFQPPPSFTREQRRQGSHRQLRSGVQTLGTRIPALLYNDSLVVLTHWTM